MELPYLFEDKIDSYTELALVRSNFYFFLSAIFLKPPTTDTIKILMELKRSPEFSNFVSARAKEFLLKMENINDGELENIVQEYHDLFKVPLSKYVAPYESVYRNGHLNGQSAMDVNKIYKRLGFQIPHEYYELPDHIGIELAFLATLCKEEQKAWTDKNVKLARSLLKTENRFLEEHIICWLPELCNKIYKMTRNNFYNGMARITLDFLQYDNTIFKKGDFNIYVYEN